MSTRFVLDLLVVVVMKNKLLMDQACVFGKRLEAFGKRLEAFGKRLEAFGKRLEAIGLANFLLLLVLTLTIAFSENSNAQEAAQTEKSTGRFVDLDPVESGVTHVHQWNPPKLHRSLLFGVYGSGVAIGDFDADGLEDVYLAQQTDAGRLYRNLGGMKFEDVTAKTGIDPAGMWSTGTTFVDINNDGQLDLFLCGFHCPNRLYINDGGKFSEKAAEYGLDFDGASVSMLFADYDRDGDLDGFLVTNYLKTNRNLRAVRPIRERGKPPRPPKGYEESFYFSPHPNGGYRRTRAGQFDRLFRNDNGKFVDVTTESGIGLQPFIGLSATWWDFNNDLWPDLYVSNDFRGPDFLYRNNGPDENGKVTFTNVLPDAIPHTPWFSMGGDFADINNDGHFDYLATDMAGTTHYRDKLSMGEMSGQNSMLWFLNWPKPPQYMRNALYINSGTERFMEAAFLTGLAKTDWTWTAKFADFDNDGWQDVYFTNGMTRDTFNGDLRAKVRDVIKVYLKSGKKPLRSGDVEQAFWEHQEPYRLENLVYQNQGSKTAGLTKFKSMGRDWGLDHLGVNTGGAIGDLDNDGDLDIVITGFEERTRVYRNDIKGGNFVRFDLRGTRSNRFGIGARLDLHVADEKTQSRFVSPMRGFMSSSETIQHFGVGDAKQIEKLVVTWPSGMRQELAGLATGKTHRIEEPNTATPPAPDVTKQETMFVESDVLKAAIHRETPFDDFARQPLLPNKMSQLGPGMAWGDVDQDGDEDLYLGGAAGAAGKLLINSGESGFVVAEQADILKDAAKEDMGALLVDVDGDSDLDLYVVSGGVECEPDSPLLEDRLYLNDGNGKFQKSTALPSQKFSGGCIAATDFDRDGDVDFFVGGRIVPGAYPQTPRSALLQNDSGNFSDVTGAIADSVQNCGMVTAAVWSDVDGDDWIDLVVTLEWGSVRVFKNEAGKLVDATVGTGLEKQIGWFNSISAGDIDNDGDTDFVVGNFGLNTKYKADDKTPTVMYYGDLDGTGNNRIVEAKFEDGVCLPRRGLGCSSHAMPLVRENKPTFHEFAISDLSGIYTDERLSKATKLEANQLRSAVLINESTGGKTKFEFRALPNEFQISPIFGSALADVNADGNLDLLVAQNFYGPQKETGYMDGGLGLLSLGDGAGGFSPIAALASGVTIPGDATSLATVDLNNDGLPDFVVGKNDSGVQVFLNQNPKNQSTAKSIRISDTAGGNQPIGGKLIVKLPGGKQRLHEVRAGSGYLSQSPTTIFGVSEITSSKWPVQEKDK